MRNFIRAALVVGTLATPMVSFADTPKKEPPAAKDDMTKTDAKETKDPKKVDKTKAEPKKDATKKDAKKDAKAPAKAE
jgi:hypothetical protein